MTTKDCELCCESFNMKTRQNIQCGYCETCVCQTCIQTYLLNTTNDPHCMKCKKEWNREFLDIHLTKKFIRKDLKNHRENILFEREKCLMPDTQESVVRIKNGRRLQAEKDKVMAEIDKLRRIVYDMDQAIHENMYPVRTGASAGESSSTRKEFIRKCPVEECKGFLSTQWHCGVCENNICSKCNEIKTADHTCNPDNVASAELIKKDTKGCPSCGQFIFRISGCAQMWCPKCHVAFNWNTLQIEKGIIHNPHYFEFQRNNRAVPNRVNGDIPCGGRPNINDILRVFGVQKHINTRMYIRDPKFDVDLFLNVLRMTIHIQVLSTTRYIAVEHNNLDIRIRYLMNEMSEDLFKKTIQQREKAFKQRREYNDIYTTFINISDDLLRQLVIDVSRVDELKETFENLRVYTNNALDKLRTRYGSRASIEFISRSWDTTDINV
jgi:hypothetical protein